MHSCNEVKFRNPKYVQIDFLKFVFSIVILLHHSYKLPSFNGVHYILQSGALSVDFFFIVSGYFMMKKVSSFPFINSNMILRESIRYISHTYARIFPFVLLSYFLGTMILLIYKNSIDLFLRILSSSIFELSGTFMFGLKGYYINSLTWFISAMIIAKFIIYPVALKYRELLTMYIAPILVFICLGFYSQNYGCLGGTFDFFGGVYVGVYRAIMGILTGCIIFKAVEVLNINIKDHCPVEPKIMRTLLTYLQCLVIFIILFYMQVMKQGRGDFIIYFVFCMLIIISLLIETNYSYGVMNRLRTINDKWHFGKLSLSIYLTQNIFFILFKLGIRMNMLSEVCLYIIGTFILSIISIKFINNIEVEKFMLRRYKL